MEPIAPIMDICIRDIRPFMVVLVDGEPVKVAGTSVMDGSNGERPELALRHGMKSAMAVRVEFMDRKPIFAHPGETLELIECPAKSKSQRGTIFQSVFRLWPASRFLRGFGGTK